MNAVLRPFVLRCPICMAPTESESVKCKYCQVPLTWEPERPLDRDDSNWRFIETGDADKDKVIMGFGPTAIAGGSNQVVQLMPQICIKPFRLYIPSSHAEGFLIDDFRIGMRSQFVSHNPLPAMKFSEREIGTTMSMDACYPGQIIQIHVTNMSTQVRVFLGSLDCKTIDTGPHYIEGRNGWGKRR